MNKSRTTCTFIALDQEHTGLPFLLTTSGHPVRGIGNFFPILAYYQPPSRCPCRLSLQDSRRAKPKYSKAERNKSPEGVTTTTRQMPLLHRESHLAELSAPPGDLPGRSTEPPPPWQKHATAATAAAAGSPEEAGSAPNPAHTSLPGHTSFPRHSLPSIKPRSPPTGEEEDLSRRGRRIPVSSWKRGKPN